MKIINKQINIIVYLVLIRECINQATTSKDITILNQDSQICRLQQNQDKSNSLWNPCKLKFDTTQLEKCTKMLLDSKAIQRGRIYSLVSKFKVGESKKFQYVYMMIVNKKRVYMSNDPMKCYPVIQATSYIMKPDYQYQMDNKDFETAYTRMTKEDELVNQIRNSGDRSVDIVQDKCDEQQQALDKKMAELDKQEQLEQYGGQDPNEAANRIMRDAEQRSKERNMDIFNNYGILMGQSNKRLIKSNVNQKVQINRNYLNNQMSSVISNLQAKRVAKQSNTKVQNGGINNKLYSIRMSSKVQNTKVNEKQNRNMQSSSLLNKKGQNQTTQKRFRKNRHVEHSKYQKHHTNRFRMRKKQ